MRQIFFIPSGPLQFPQIRGANFHIWTDDEGKSVGVVEMDGSCDAERVIERLEEHGIDWLPNHHGTHPISDKHVAHLSKHGVRSGETTLEAMTKVHAVAGFPPLRPKRF